MGDARGFIAVLWNMSLTLTAFFLLPSVGLGNSKHRNISTKSEEKHGKASSTCMRSCARAADCFFAEFQLLPPLVKNDVQFGKAVYRGSVLIQSRIFKALTSVWETSAKD
jgi:hypothetical protein